MKRLHVLGLISAVAALPTSASLLAGSAAAHAQAPLDDDERAIRLVATTTGYHTNAGKRPAATDATTFTLRLTDRGGHAVGADQCACTAVDKDNLVCTGVLRLRGGQLTYTGPFSLTGVKATAAITGGTGRYVGAAGTMTVLTRANTDPAVYDYRLTLVGRGGSWSDDD